MRNTIEKNGMNVHDMDVCSTGEPCREVKTPQEILHDFIDGYFSVEPYKAFLHELFVSYVATWRIDGMSNHDKETFTCNYRNLFYFLNDIENYRIQTFKQ